MLKVHFQTFIVKNLIVMSVNRYFITICDDEKQRKLFGRISLPGLDPGCLRHPQFTLTTALVAVARKAQRVRGLSPPRWQKMDWLMILLSPFVVVFVYPVVLLIMMYGSAVFLHVYRHRRREIYDAYTGNFWDGAMQTVAAVFDSHGSLWHGYELLGMDKLPAKGPALLIYYHGALPLDMYYILARLLLCKKRRLRNVSATFLFHVPGIQLLLEVCGAVEGRSREQCVEILKNGELLAISPGGVREALFSDEYYTMIWNGRRGFAKVALEAQVPIYPVYTQNIREAIRSIQIGRKWFRKLYEWTKLPLVPLYGGFPVKLRTYIGNPVHYDAKMTCDELAGKVQREIQEMIVTHQQLPGSIFAALQDRRNSTTDKKQM